jgi:prepilin-type N-terminal cleavage/methylation domain-containing protein
MKKIKSGFTLIEVLIVIGIIAVLAAAVLVAINPARQFAQARNSQRMSNIQAILNAIGQNMADNRGIFSCSSGTIPTTPTLMKSTGGYDIRPCLVPTYLPELPVDPSGGLINNATDYNTGYTVAQDSLTKRFLVSAPSAELDQTISLSR